METTICWTSQEEARPHPLSTGNNNSLNSPRLAFDSDGNSNDFVQADVEEDLDAVMTTSSMMAADGYASDHYCHELDNLNLNFGASFDDYFFASPVSKTESSDSRSFPKRETSIARPIRLDCVDSQALPVITNIKSEYPIPYQCGGDQIALCLDTAAFSPTSDLGSSCSASPAVIDSSDSAMGLSAETGFEVYHDLIMRHLIQDIDNTCARLSISRDPKLWTPTDSIAWLMDMSSQYHLSQVPYDKLGVDGATLCSMSLGQFAQCFPNGGETVHAQLQIWNSANEYCSRQSSTSNNNNNSNMVSVNTEEPVMAMSDQQQFVHHSNPTSVIQRLRTADDGHAAASAAAAAAAAAYPYAQFLLQPHQDQQFGTNQLQPPASFGMGSILPSPGSCSDSGMSIEGDYVGLVANGGGLDTAVRAINPCGNGSNIHLWQFLRELLEQHEKYGQCVRWIDHNAGIFKIEDSHALARLWGKRKNRPAMNYDKLSRSLRQYYKKNILKKTTRSQRLVYQFLHPYHVC